MLHYWGHGVAKDCGRARAWFEKAAAAGDPEGLSAIGSLHGEGHGTPQNFKIRQEHTLKRAIAAGSTSAMVGLGKLYRDGNGVVKGPAAGEDLV